MMKKYKQLFLILLLIILFNGCEDDPLLAPQTESEDDGGSYGNLSLPGTDQSSDKDNPEVF
tara:strand:+ start:151 stop:333 length:183 start_codon:yes stop_codon:yes gene_type:complete